MSRYDHPSYGRHTRAHWNAEALQSPASAAGRDAVTYSGASRPLSPSGRDAHDRRAIGLGITGVFCGLFLLLSLFGESCDGGPRESVFCAEKFCEPVAP